MSEPLYLFPLIAGLFGLLIGSFLNVCIHRWPRDFSVVRPRSRCPECEHQIAWSDNIPVLSWLLLRARCRHCHAPIHWRYPLVELLTGLSFVIVVVQYDVTPEAAKDCVFASILIGLIFSDLDSRLLPDQFTIGGWVIGILFSLFVELPDGTVRFLVDSAGLTLNPRVNSLAAALVSGLLPASILWLMGWLFEKIRHKQGLGFGDIKMIAMIGAFLGLSGTLLTIIVGSVTGSVIGMTYIIAARENSSQYQLPFASFLGAGALIVLLFGQSWYWSLFG